MLAFDPIDLKKMVKIKNLASSFLSYLTILTSFNLLHLQIYDILFNIKKLKVRQATSGYSK